MKEAKDEGQGWLKLEELVADTTMQLNVPACVLQVMNIRERGSILYLGMAMEILNLP